MTNQPIKSVSGGPGPKPLLPRIDEDELESNLSKAMREAERHGGQPSNLSRSAIQQVIEIHNRRLHDKHAYRRELDREIDDLERTINAWRRALDLLPQEAK